MSDSFASTGVAAEPPLVARLRAAGCVFAEDEARLLLQASAEAVACDGMRAGAGAPPDAVLGAAPDAVPGAVPRATRDRLESMVGRRVAGEPLEHILGWAYFCGRRIAVGPGVFVPRQRTGFLVRRAAGLTQPGGVVLDLCCGSGALGVVLAASVPNIELHAADVDPVAVRYTRRNLADHPARVYEGDLFAALPVGLRGRIDTIVCNAPYVPTAGIATMPPEARLHEPRSTLDGGTDGLDVHRRVAAEVGDWLTTGGHVLIETGRDQGPVAVAMFDEAGLTADLVECDDVGATVVIASR